MELALLIQGTNGEKIIKAINEAVAIKHAQESYKQDLKDITDLMKEDYGIKAAEFNAAVKVVYENDLAEREATLEGLKAVVDAVSNA